MAKKKVTKKKSVLPKLLIGAGLIGGGYLLYTKVLKPYLDAQKDSTDTSSPDAAIEKTVSAASNTTPNVPSASATINPFSPIGTAKSKLKLYVPITYGSKGEEIKQLQILLNGIRQLYINAGKTPPFANKIGTDGDYGTQTWNAQKTIEPQAKPLIYWTSLYTQLSKGFGSSASAPAGASSSSSAPAGSSALIGFTAAGLPGAIVGGAYDWLYGGN